MWPLHRFYHDTEVYDQKGFLDVLEFFYLTNQGIRKYLGTDETGHFVASKDFRLNIPNVS